MVLRLAMRLVGNLKRLNLTDFRNLNLVCCICDEVKLSGSFVLIKFIKKILAFSNVSEFKSVLKMTANSQDLVMNIKVEEVESESEAEAAAASSLNEAMRDVKTDPERQWLQCLNNDDIKKEPLGRTCEKCGRFTMVKNHKCETRCKICDKKLSTKYYLVKHMQTVHRNEADFEYFECDLCGQKLQQKHFLVRHLKLKHEGNQINKFQCDFDDKIFVSKEKLKAHMKGHRAVSKCEICRKKVKYIKEHMKLIHFVEDITVACKICGKILKNKLTLKSHLKTHNKKFECRVCGQKFAFLSRFKTHLKIHDDPWAFQCQICFKKYNSSSSLSKHVSIHDNNRPKPYQCEHCDYATAIKTNFKNHLKVHDKNRIKDLKCSKCDYITDNSAYLKQHIETHNPNRTKYPCLYCDFTAIFKSSLNIHMRTHNPDRVKNLKCTHCNYETDNKGYFRQHIKKHDKNRVRNFECSICKKSFQQKCVLKQHVKTHAVHDEQKE
jgi:hypothetical protein